MDVDNKIDYRKRIADYYKSKEYQKVQDFFSQTTFFDILGKARDENAHSSFLAWLLNPSSNQLGVIPMKLFLQLICEAAHQIKANGANKLPKELQNIDINPEFEIENLRITREQSISFGSKSSRDGGIDVFATFTLVINGQRHDNVLIIENKVFSKEHDNIASGKKQTVAYKDWVDINYPNYSKTLVYLTPMNTAYLKNLTQVDCSCQDYIQINYQMIVDDLIENLIDKRLDVKTFDRLKDYLVCLSKPSSIEINNVEKETMAMDKEHKQILQDFWNKNKDLIFAAINSLDLDAPEREVMDKAMKTARSLFSISYNGKEILTNIGMNRVAMEIIRDHCSRDKTETYASLRSTFENVSVNTVIDGQRNIIAKQEDARNHQEKDRKTGSMKYVKRFHYDDELSITLGDGDKIVISTQWDVNNNFIEMQEIVKKWGYSIYK